MLFQNSIVASDLGYLRAAGVFFPFDMSGPMHENRR